MALMDVSGSMAMYSHFFLEFVFALQNALTHVESFVLSTRLTRVTPLLRGSDWRTSVNAIAEGVPDWAGGTRLGASMATFAESWTARLDRRTVVLILSDGWDTGDPALLADSLRRIRARVRRIIWLNPLLAEPRYQPEARGMAAALPHVDVLAPFYNLVTLRALAVRLASRR